MLLIDLAIRSRIMQLQRARKSIVCTFILLSTDDLERLAVAAYLTGRSTDSASAWTRAHPPAICT